MKGKIFLVALAIICCAHFSYFIACNSTGTDFPAFYRVAKIVLDPTMPITTIYEIDDPTNRYNIPDRFMEFRYSVSVAYLMAPLGLLPYFVSKAIFVFINIILSIASLAIALRLGGSTRRWFFYPLVLSVFFIPFIHTMCFGQTSGILLFLITVAVVAAIKNRFYLCGLLIGVAVLFKLYPIAIAMGLGIKNWRIFASCLIPVTLTTMLPAFKEWIASFTVLPFLDCFYSVPYRYLDIKLFTAYLLFIGLASAYFIYRNRHLKYEQLTAFAIPAMFLAVPIIEPNHLLLMFFPFGYMLSSIREKGGIGYLKAILSLVFITAGSKYLPKDIYIITSQFLYVGLLFALAAIIMAISAQHGLNKWHKSPSTSQ